MHLNCCSQKRVTTKLILSGPHRTKEQLFGCEVQKQQRYKCILQLMHDLQCFQNKACQNKFIFLKQVFAKSGFLLLQFVGERSALCVSAYINSSSGAHSVQSACKILSSPEISHRASSSSFTLKHPAHCANSAAYVHNKHSQLPLKIPRHFSHISWNYTLK